MKKLSLLAAALLAGLVSVSAQAVTATGTFNVDITLTSACKIATVPTVAFTYVSFQATAVPAADIFDIQCTNLLPITSITLDSTAVTDAATNLAYTLTVGTLLNPVPTAGTGAAQSIGITGSMAAGQAGTCAAASCNNALSSNKTRTLTITY